MGISNQLLQESLITQKETNLSFYSLVKVIVLFNGLHFIVTNKAISSSLLYFSCN